MSYTKYLKEALKLDEKKKRKHDRELPWTGLNWGEDKGKGIDTFNHLNGTEFSGATAEAGGCFEGIELDEDKTRSIDENQLIAKTFAGKVLKSLIKAQEDGGIQNIPDIEEFVKNSLKSKPVILPELRPSTRSLVITSNTRGAGSEEAEAKKEVVHHVFALTGDGIDDIETTLTLQNNTRLHNATVSKLKDKIKSEISDIVEIFKKLSSKVVRNINKETSDEQLMRLQTILYYLQAWAIREIFSRVSKDKDYVSVYQQLLSQELNEYIVSHPELVLSKLDKPVTIKVPNRGDYKVKIVINTINKDQRDSLHRYMSGNILKDFPIFLDNDFIVAEIVDGPDNKGKIFKDLDEFRDFFGLSGNIDESLCEARDEEFITIPPVEFRRYLENNLLVQPLVSEYTDGATKNSPFYREIVNVLYNLTDKTFSESSLVRKINDAGESDKKLWSLKQKAVAEVVRNLLDSYNFKLKYKRGEKPLFKNKLYKLNVDDVRINMGEQEYKLSEKPGVIFNIEKLFGYILNKYLIETNIEDEHFLDIAGNPVPGVKYIYKDDCISGILIDPDCHLTMITTLVVDRPVSNETEFRKAIQRFSTLDTLVIDEKTSKVIPDRYWVSKNSTSNGLFSYLPYSKVLWKNPRSSGISAGCFSRCGELHTFDIPSTVIRLGEQAFAYSALKHIFIPKEVTNIGDNCFEGCSGCVITFEISKEDLPKYSSSWYSSRLLSGKEEYKGLTGKWGKSQVKKIIWGGSRPETETKHESLQLNEDIAAVRNMFKDIPQDIFDRLLIMDPTYVEGRNSVGKYTKWLLNLYKKGLLKEEDFYKIPDLLLEFEEKRRWMENKDIQQFRSLGELADALSKVEVGELSDNAKQKAEHKKLAGMDLSDINAEKVFEDNDWVVYVPKDFEASRKLSSISNSAKGNNRWCTGISARDSTYFDNYTRQGPLYININKNDPQEESYQFHFESRQFMNKNDRSISLLKFLLNNKGLADFYLNKLGKEPDIKQALDELQSKRIKPIVVNFNPSFLGTKDEISKLLINAINNYDYETVLDLYGGLQLPDVEEFRKQVSRIELNDECKQLLNKLGISEEEYKQAVNGDNTELSAIVEEAILTSIKRNIIDQIKAYIGTNVIDSNQAITEFDWENKKLSFDKIEVIDQLLHDYWGGKEVNDENINNKIERIIKELPSSMKHILAHGDKAWRPALDRLNKAKYLYELANSLRYHI